VLKPAFKVENGPASLDLPEGREVFLYIIGVQETEEGAG